MSEAQGKEEQAVIQPENPEISKLRADFAKEFDEFKKSMSAEMDKKDAQIKELTAANDSLRASIVRSSVVQPAPAPKEKTQEELRAEEVARIVEKTKAEMKALLMGV